MPVAEVAAAAHHKGFAGFQTRQNFHPVVVFATDFDGAGLHGGFAVIHVGDDEDGGRFLGGDRQGTLGNSDAIAAAPPPG